MTKDFILLNLSILRKTFISSKKLLQYWKAIEKALRINIIDMHHGTQYWEKVMAYIKEEKFPIDFVETLNGYPLLKPEIEKEYSLLKGANVKIISWWDDAYPIQLKYINDPPIFLFAAGNEKLLTQFNRMFAFVGTRNPSFYGRKVAKSFMWQANLGGIITVSGFAAGIDTLVFDESLKNGVPTVAVLPYLPMEFPFGRIKKDTLFVSEYFAPQIGNAKWMYVERNRIIAALSKGIVVIEAPPKSGALITADFGYSYNRYVYYVGHSMENISGSGGVLHSIMNNEGRVIRSFYDILRDTDENMMNLFTSNLEKYISGLTKKYLNSSKLNNELKISVNSRNITHHFWNWCGKNLKLFQNVVIELKRLDMIHEYKGQILINFLYSPSSWQKT